MTKVLIVTNDFPPRSGGIQSFVHALASRLPADGVVVYAPAWQGAAEFDARQAFPVIRHPGSLMLPVPSVRSRACALLTVPIARMTRQSLTVRAPADLRESGVR